MACWRLWVVILFVHLHSPVFVCLGVELCHDHARALLLVGWDGLPVGPSGGQVCSVLFLFLFRACSSCVLCFLTVFCVSSPVFQLLCLVRGCRGAGHSVCWSLLGDWLIRVEDVFSVFGLCDVLTFPMCGSCFFFRPPFFPAVVVLSLVGRSSCRPRPRRRPCVLWTADQSSSAC